MTEALAHMDAHQTQRVLSESYPMNTNMTGFRWFFQNICVLVLWAKVALALEGLNHSCLQGLSHDLETGCPKLAIV